MSSLDARILSDLKRQAILRDGHFAFSSGHHSSVLIDRDRLLTDPVGASHMGYAIAKHFFTAHVETVAVPSIWGAGLAQWVAYFLDPKANIVTATPIQGKPTIASNVEYLIRERRVLLVDNVISTGETMRPFAALVERLGGEIIGIGTLWSGIEKQIAGHEIFGLLNTAYDSYPPDQCPLCAAGGTPEAAPY
jgi:orotate phosphoribosyltransferase